MLLIIIIMSNMNNNKNIILIIMSLMNIVWKNKIFLWKLWEEILFLVLYEKKLIYWIFYIQCKFKNLFWRWLQDSAMQTLLVMLEINSFFPLLENLAAPLFICSIVINIYNTKRDWDKKEKKFRHVFCVWYV